MTAQKDLGGRPLKFQTVASLQEKIDEYFGNCDPHVEEEVLELAERANGEQYSRYRKRITEQKPYTIHGLARALDTTRETLRDYESGKYDNKDLDAEVNQKFSDTITRAKAKIAEFAESQLYISGASHGAQFNLKNNYNWVDESSVKTTNVTDDLNDLDDRVDINDEKAEVAVEAAKELEGKDGQGSSAPEQVVETDSPIQDPK